MSPPPLRGAAAAYDADSQTIVLFGGALASGTLSQYTWVWNGSGWQQVLSSPPARTGASMAFDPALHQLILFGGAAADGTRLGDTWAWNGASWVQLAPTASPSARQGASMALDPSGDLVLFGGEGPGPAGNPQAGLNSTSNPASNQVASAQAPTVDAQPANALLANTQLANTLLANTQLANTQLASTALVSTNGAADQVLGDTWTWNGQIWQPIAVTTGPSARRGAAIAYDYLHAQTVLFGGSTDAGATPVAASQLADTWIWNGAGWLPAQPSASPSPRQDTAIGFDATLGVTVLFGGSGAPSSPSGAPPTSLGDTWTWDGGSWVALAAATPPAGRQDAVGAYDAASHQFVVFGGVNSNGNVLGDTDVLAAKPPIAVTATTAAGPTTTAPAATVPPGSIPAFHPPAPPAQVPTASSVPPSSVPSGPSRPVSLPPITVKPLPPLVATVHAVHQGDLVTLHGSGFRPGAEVTITFHSAPLTVGQTIADRDGRFAVTVAVPTGAVTGDHHFEAAGMNAAGGMTTLVTDVEVVSLVTPHPSGSSVQTPVMVAVAVGIPIITWMVLGWRGRTRRPVAGTGAPTVPSD